MSKTTRELAVDLTIKFIEYNATTGRHITNDDISETLEKVFSTLVDLNQNNQ
ncbi:hypothetical protein [Cetobacterium sp.]|uniref:hypothetical protein n=1 Tax=Cetobacterium sp. TaxID=2071632 RepID=UPI003EE59F13